MNSTFRDSRSSFLSSESWIFKNRLLISLSCKNHLCVHFWIFFICQSTMINRNDSDLQEDIIIWFDHCHHLNFNWYVIWLLVRSSQESKVNDESIFQVHHYQKICTCKTFNEEFRYYSWTFCVTHLIYFCLLRPSLHSTLVLWVLLIRKSHLAKSVFFSTFRQWL